MFKSSTMIKLFSVFSFVIFGIVVAKLFYLQVYEKDKYTKLVEMQSDPKLSVLTDRGYIYDKDGRLLARNKSAGSLYAYRKNIPNKYEFFKALEKNGIRVSSKAKKSLKETDSFTWIARQIDLAKAVKLSEEIEGLEYFVEDARFYPQGSLMANVVGFTGSDNIGRSGIEYFLNNRLEGKKVNIASLRDSRRKVILFEDKLELASPDTQVYVTISSRIQAGAEHILREGAKNFGAKNGSVVAMDIKTGEIILAASVNGFDPHNYWKYQPSSWVNHGFNYVFEPGSIFKTVAFSYLHNSNKLDRNRLIDTSKKITIGKYTYSDTKYYGTLTVDEVFTHSSNIGMTQLIRGENSNRKGFYDFLVNAGFGGKTGVYGANEESGIVKPVELWSKTSLTSMAIGYEVLVTPLQVVRFYAAVANGGVMVNPKIISKIVKGNETAIPEHTEKQIMSIETASYMLDLMRQTVEAGTGKKADTALTKIAGKTGTARVYDNKAGAYSTQNYSASFAGVFPAKDPKIAMIVVYESPKSSIYGGSTAANVFRQIAEFVSTEKHYFDEEIKVVSNDN